MQKSDEKIQKVLARCGLASRREIEKWLQAGRIVVNKQVAKLGDRITITDHVSVDGRTVCLTTSMPTRVLCYNKPLGEVCTRDDPEGRPTVFAALPRLTKGRWVMVGRLDINTSGLLLFTNDGELANQLMHPSQQVQRYYAVRVMGQVTDIMLEKLRHGVMLEDGLAAFTSISHQPHKHSQGINQWYRVSLGEGRNREVRRLWESQGVKVSRLLRVGYATVRLSRNLAQGEYFELTSKQIANLRKVITNRM